MREAELENLKERELELERKLDELPSLEKLMEADLEYTRDRILNLETQKDVEDMKSEDGYNPMTATEIVKRRYGAIWDSYTNLLRVKRDIDSGDVKDVGELYIINKRLNQLKPDLIKTPPGKISKEGDPNGMKPSDPGAKLDAGKPRAGLLASDFHHALKMVVAVISFGADKYTASGWLSVPNAESRYKDALYRHLLAMESEEKDPDSGLLHLAHAAWNALALLELATRPKPETQNNGFGLGPK